MTTSRGETENLTLSGEKESVWFIQRQMANILSCHIPNSKTQPGGYAHRHTDTVASVMLNNVHTTPVTFLVCYL